METVSIQTGFSGAVSYAHYSIMREISRKPFMRPPRHPENSCAIIKINKLITVQLWYKTQDRPVSKTIFAVCSIALHCRPHSKFSKNVAKVASWRGHEVHRRQKRSANGVLADHRGGKRENGENFEDADFPAEAEQPQGRQQDFTFTTRFL